MSDPVGQVFLRLLFMVVTPLVFTSVALGVTSLGDPAARSIPADGRPRQHTNARTRPGGPAHHPIGGAQMRVRDLQRLYDYHYWANRHLMGVVSRLTRGQFTQPMAGSYGSIRNTLVHILSAEWGWLERCGGAKRGERLNPRDYPTAESLVHAWTRVEAHVRRFLSGLDDEDLTREIEFAIGDGPKQSVPLGDLLQHAAVHAVHHRGQVALLLRMLGHMPGNFDLLLYVGATRSVPA